MRRGNPTAVKGLGKVLKSVQVLHLSKNATDYWAGINGAFVSVLKSDGDLWTAEKTASLEALGVAKEESLTYLRAERNRLLGLSHKQAIEEIIRLAGLDSRIAQVERVEHGGLLGD